MSKKHQGKHFTVPVDLYGTSISCSIAQSDGELSEFFLGHLSDWTDVLTTNSLQARANSSAGAAAILSSGHCFLYIRDHPSTQEGKCSIAHEVFHLADYILERIGTPLTPETREPYAYLIGYITKEIYKHF